MKGMSELQVFDLCYIFTVQKNRLRMCPEKHPWGFKTARKPRCRSALWESCGTISLERKTEKNSPLETVELRDTHCTEEIKSWG